MRSKRRELTFSRTNEAHRLMSRPPEEYAVFVPDWAQFRKDKFLSYALT